MKIIISLLLISGLLTCNNSSNMESDFRHVLERKKKLNLYEISYNENGPADPSFYKGYTVKQEKTINKKSIRELVGLVSDSTNYWQDRSKNCVMVASYGLKLKGDSASYVVFIGKQPCLKLLVLNEKTNAETILDLTDENRIVPFFDSLFVK